MINRAKSAYNRQIKNAIALGLAFGLWRNKNGFVMIGRWVTMSKKVEHQVVRIIYIVVIAMISLYLVSPFLAPIIFGGTVALTLYPVLLKLEAKGLTRKKASAILTTIFGVLVSVPFFFFIVKGTLAIVAQLQKFSQSGRFRNMGVNSIIQTIKHDVILSMQTYGERFGLKPFITEAKVDQYLVKINAFLLEFFQAVAANLPEIFLFFLVMIACTYSFLKNAQTCRQVFQKILGFNNQKMDQLVKIFIMDSRSVYVSNIATGGVQSLIVAIAASLLNFADFFLVFFITLILSFIPVVGAAPVAFVFAVVAWFQGQTSNAIIMAVVGMFTGVADNFLRPYLASMGQSKIPTISAFVFVVGGALLFGFPGLFIGLLVGSFAYDTLPLFWEEVGKSNVRPPTTYMPEFHREDGEIFRRH